MSSLFRSIFRVAAPIVGSMIPGVGPVLGSALGGALGGAVGGGGLKGALLGGLTGGVGGYLGAGGLGNPSTTINWTSAAPGYATGLETVGGSGILGGLSRAGEVGGGLARGVSSLANSAGSGGFNGLKTAGSIFGAMNDSSAYDDIAKYQLQGTKKAIDANMPFLSTGTAANTRLSGLLGLDGQNDDDILEMLRSSPGYQFRLEQGQDALNKSLAARGMTFSGGAIKEAQNLGQGLADQTYKDYVSQLMAQSDAGQKAGLTIGGLYDTQGDIRAKREQSQSNNLDQLLAQLLYQNGG